MPSKSPDTSNPKTIQKLIRQGRGQNRGAEYLSWIRPREFSSKGMSRRINGWKVNARDVAVLSGHESDFLYNQEIDPTVKDYREQFPLLPLEETVEIADQLGVPHPVNPETNRPRVMTTDFVLTRNVPEKDPFDEAICIKEAKDLEDGRTLEKLEIERRYWKLHGIDWWIVTENEINSVVARGVEAVHKYFWLRTYPQLTPEVLNVVRASLGPKLRDPQSSLAALANTHSKAMGIAPRRILSAALHLIASGEWKVDFTKPFNTSDKVVVLNAPKD